MFIQRYIQKQSEQVARHFAGQVLTLAEFRQLAQVEQLIFYSSSLLCQKDAEITQVYTVQDQTEESRQRVLHIAASLCSGPGLPLLLQALAHSARQVGLPIRETEVDLTLGMGVIGKLDRSVYVVGDATCMTAEGVNLGVTSMTLAQQIESEGKYPLFLAMQGPKRLLAVFAVSRKLMPEIPKLLEQLDRQHIRVSLLTTEPISIASRFYQSTPLLQVMPVSDAEQKAKQLRICLERPDAMVVAPRPMLNQLPGSSFSLSFGSAPIPRATITVPSLAVLPEAFQVAHSLLGRTKRRFFWCKL